MGAHMKETLLRKRFKERDVTNGVMAVFSLVNGKIILWKETELEFSYFHLVKNMKDNTKMTRNMDKELLHGLTVEDI